METTLTAMLFSGGRAALAHVGDSRAIRLRSGRLRQITEDHTIGNLVADAGCSRRCSHGTWTAGQTVRPIRACGICGPVAATCCALADSARSSDDRPHFYVLTLRAASTDAPSN